MVEASSVSPNLAHKALTERFGPLERSEHGLAEVGGDAAGSEAVRSYAKGPHQREGATKQLWARYQAERSASLEGRKVAHAALGADFAKYDVDLRAYHKERRAKIQAQLYLAGPDKRAMYKRLDEERYSDWSK